MFGLTTRSPHSEDYNSMKFLWLIAEIIFFYCFEQKFKKITLKYGKNLLFHGSFNEYQIHQVAHNPQHLKYTFEKCEKYILA